MPPASLYTIGAGYAGTRDTLAYMRALVRHDVAEPIVTEATAAIVGAERHPETQAALIRSWVDDHSTFVRDPAELELLVAPALQLTTIRTLGSASGDCDDVATLAATLGLAVGLRARFVVVGRHHFEHVFTVLGDSAGRRWWELDTTRPYQTVPAALQRHVFTIEV